MNSPFSSSNESVGYLIVKVSTARGAIPLSDATVRIRGGTPESSGILLSLQTDRDGQTQRVSLPTPPKSFSASPNDEKPYSVYNIDVFKEGYVPLEFQAVPIFPDVTSIQPAVMVPAPQLFGTSSIHDAATVIPEMPEADL